MRRSEKSQVTVFVRIILLVAPEVIDGGNRIA